MGSAVASGSRLYADLNAGMSKALKHDTLLNTMIDWYFEAKSFWHIKFGFGCLRTREESLREIHNCDMRIESI
jgi:hypothetical protein